MEMLTKINRYVYLHKTIISDSILSKDSYKKQLGEYTVRCVNCYKNKHLSRIIYIIKN